MKEVEDHLYIIRKHGMLPPKTSYAGTPLIHSEKMEFNVSQAKNDLLKRNLQVFKNIINSSNNKVHSIKKQTPKRQSQDTSSENSTIIALSPSPYRRRSKRLSNQFSTPSSIKKTLPVMQVGLDYVPEHERRSLSFSSPPSETSTIGDKIYASFESFNTPTPTKPDEKLQIYSQSIHSSPNITFDDLSDVDESGDDESDHRPPQASPPKLSRILFS